MQIHASLTISAKIEIWAKLVLWFWISSLLAKILLLDNFCKKLHFGENSTTYLLMLFGENIKSGGNFFLPWGGASEGGALPRDRVIDFVNSCNSDKK